MTHLIGQSIGRYRILEQLGEGGMATVYKALDTRLEREVAVKIIRKGALPADALENILKRFEREAKALARLAHPNIVHINDYGEHEGIPYLVMDYLPGGTILPRLGKPTPWPEALRFLLPIAQALECAHAHNIIHRDIKPANILLNEKGQPMLSDFGLVKIMQSADAQTLTGTGMVVGTPEYMAPEQWTEQTGPQSDLYSLGVVLYEMVAGRKPYVADTPGGFLLKQANDPLPDPSQFVKDLPEAVARFLLKALAKDPKQRYPDMTAMVQAMEGLLGGGDTAPRQAAVSTEKPAASRIEQSDARGAPAGGQPARVAQVRQDAPRGATPPQKRPVSAWLVVSGPGEAARDFPLQKDSCTIGRNAENDLVLPLRFVSRHHGRLEKRGGTWFYKDLDSQNGTFVDGQMVREASLLDGSMLRIGDEQGNSVSLKFHERQIGEVRPAVTGLTPIQTARLPTRGTVLIGRCSEAGVRLDSPVVSRRHAMLEPSGEGMVLRDLGSNNGTFVNGRRISQPTRLQRGDVVQIGPFRLVYEATDQLKPYAATRGIRLDGVDISWDVIQGKKRRRILNDINISCYPQEFVGLVGGSGAGKSTLMKALSGILPTQGKVLVEGEDLHTGYDYYRTMIGYVPQDDILHRELTVEQALRYAAKLRLPPDITETEIEGRIQRVLDQVELTAQRKQSINSLSGGQRKRASIAVELLADPPLFFLDEPTSGLDPGLEKKMMFTLRKLADGGKTIVLVTHATDNINQCDHVAFMSQGRMVYFGPPQDARQFFQVEQQSFADIYTATSDPVPQEAQRKAASWEERFKQSDFYRKYVAERVKSLQVKKAPQVRAAPRPAPTRSNPLRQFWLLTRRYFDLILRDRVLLTVLLAIMPLLAILLLFIAEPQWLTGDSVEKIEQILRDAILGGDQSAGYSIVTKSQRLLFIMGLAAVMLGLFSSAYEIVKERSVYARERMVFLKLVPYLLSKVVLLSAFAALQCLLFMIVVGLKVDFPAKGVFLPMFLEMYVTLVLGAVAAICLGLLISALAPNSNSVTYIVLAVLFIQIVFAGIVFDLPGAAGNLSTITLSRWTTEALGTSADMEYLNTLSRTRFQPDPVTEEISFEYQIPDPDWEPVTVVTEKKQIPGCTYPVDIPTIVENELVEVTETRTETHTFEPEAVDVDTPFEFELDYKHSTGHLFVDWGMLVGLSVLFFVGTVFVMKGKDKKLA